MLSPETQPDMGLEDEERMLAGSGEPREEEEGEELVDPLTTVREQREQLEKCVKARGRQSAVVSMCPPGHRNTTAEELFHFWHTRDHCVAHRLF